VLNRTFQTAGPDLLDDELFILQIDLRCEMFAVWVLCADLLSQLL